MVRFTAGDAEPVLVKMTVSPLANTRDGIETTQLAAVKSQMFA